MSAQPPVPDLPAPEDDGAADHLPGAQLPPLDLPASDGEAVRLDRLATRSVVFVYPGIGGHLGRDARLEEWTALPGARGCTAEACSFRDELSGFATAGATVFGLSGESVASQREHVERLHLPYRLLSDESLRLRDALALPTFEFDGHSYLRRLTLIVAGGRVEAALYPVFPPQEAAAQALAWLDQHPAPAGR